MQSRLRWSVLVLALALLASACNRGGGDVADVPSPVAATTEASEEEESESEEDESEEESEDDGGSAEGAVTSVDDANAAVVQIVAEGTFRDVEFGEYEGSGAGSGFIIDPEGIVVTNNHVVTGSATLDVYLDGEDEPLNARVLGYSECSDLAVIDLEGEDYPYLEWYEDEVAVRLDVFSAGFPLGDPEYSLQDGTVNRADYDIETNWASVENIVEHSARINPGNSGGPLLTEEGQVVGVNYAGDPETDQNLAISASEAMDIVETLRGEENVTSIGVNGQAVSDGESISGVWVTSVDSGSPADNAGLQPGDIITRMEGVTLAEDETMSQYCDVLRSRDPDDVLAIEVLRYDSEEVLEGQINGDELVQSFSFAQEEAEAVTTTEPDTAVYGEYMTISDDTGAISLEVPVEWGQVDGRPFTDAQGRPVSDVRAASNLESFQNSWETPGVIVSASSALAQTGNELTLIDELVEPLSGQCTYDGRQPYADPAYTGQFDTYTECGGVGASYIVLGAVPPGREYVIRVQVQINGERDLEALDRVISSFVVIGNV